MFEIGKVYNLTTVNGRGHETLSSGWRVEEVNGCLVKFSRDGEEQIVNTTSNGFVKAEPNTSVTVKITHFGAVHT